MKIYLIEASETKKYIEKISRRLMIDSKEEKTVKKIIGEVKKYGDEAIVRYIEKFDKIKLTPEKFKMTEKEWQEGIKNCPEEIKNTIDITVERLQNYYKHSQYNSWFFYDDYGNLLGSKVLPLNKVLVYAPGGKATYPSTVMMGAVPAKMAGVREINLTTPARREGVAPSVLYAAFKAGITNIYKIGGAQAIAGFTFGTNTLPKVDKIVGPGNIYVATAKRLLYGLVDIDMIAGPSEVLIIFDKTAPLEYIAIDMLSQLEHDEQAMAIAITDDKKKAENLKKILKEKGKKAKRAEIIKNSIKKSAIIVVPQLMEAVDIANEIAPEHLEIMTDNPMELLPYIKNAGAIFLGKHTPEAVGDYIAGPNHILPTGGTARFSSPLGVESFIKRTSILSFNKKGLQALGKYVARIADEEGLFSHGESVRERIGKDKEEWQ